MTATELVAEVAAAAGKASFFEGLEWHADYEGFHHSSSTANETRNTDPAASCIVRILSSESPVLDSLLSVT